MNNDIDALVSGINESKSLMDIKKKGGIKRLIVNNFMFFELTLSLMSLGEVLTLINKKCGVDIEYNYCSRILNQIRKTKLTPSVNEKKLLAKKNNNLDEKKPSTTGFEKGNNTDIDLSGFKNLNRLSLKLISDHGLTLSDLEKMGIKGIGDDMAVYEKIDRFCEKLKVKSKREKYSNL